MSWSLAGVVIRPGNRGYGGSAESFHARQQVIDDTEETISYYGAGSQERSVKFILFENDNGGTGRNTIDAARIADANVALVSDIGSEGNFRILSWRWERVLDVANSLPVYDCTAELIKV